MKKKTKEDMKKEEIKPPEVVPAEKPPEVRLEAVEVQPVTPPTVVSTTPTVVPEPQPAVKPPELGASIDNLAKIVDSSSSVPQTPPTPVITEQKESKQGYVWLLVSFLLGLALGVGAGYFMWGKTIKTPAAGTPVVKIEPTQVPQITPTETPAAASGSANLQKSSLKLEVLNGSGGKGVAAKAKDLLTAAGYTSVATGNADTEDFAQTEIAIKASKNDYLTGLKSDLSGTYTIADKVTTLPESSKYDAVITVGAK
jgi:hypothetical protein